MQSENAESDLTTEFDESGLASCDSAYEATSSVTETLKSSSEEYETPHDFDDNCDGVVKFPYKPNHVLLIHRNLQIGLCTNMEVIFPDATFKCHRWIIDAFMDIDNLKHYPTSKEKFITEYFCCLKSPELPMLLRAYYRKSNTQDFTVYIGYEKFECHYDVLRCYTDFFDKMKRYESVKLPISEVSMRAFFMIYRGWMLDQIPELPIRGILETYKAAQYLRIEFLIKAIAESLQKYKQDSKKKEEEGIKRKAPKLVHNFHIEKLPISTQKDIL